MIVRMSAVVGFAFLLLLSSCGDEGTGARGPNLPPDTEIVSGPDSGSVVPYLVTLDWMGTDEDGRVVGYEFAWRAGGDSTVPEADADLWHYTTKTESTFAAAADSSTGEGLYLRQNTFFVRAVDNDGGIDPEPAALTFTATTTPPHAQITYPSEPGETSINLSRCVTVRWEGLDDDGEAVDYRYTFKPYGSWPGPGVPYPQNDKTHWSPWSTTTEAVLPLDEDESIYTWSFFVQARDNAGAAETSFQPGRNFLVIAIDPSLENKPSVTICCHRGLCSDNGAEIDCRSSSNPSQMAVPVHLDVGDTVCFRASFQPGKSATSVEGIAFRVNNPERPYYWEDAASTSNLHYPGVYEAYTVEPGLTAIYVWVKDDYCENGSTNFAYIEIAGD
jgi:hypothetical protein